MTESAPRPYADNDALLAELRVFGELLLDGSGQGWPQAEAKWRAIVARMAATLESQIFIGWVHVAAMFRLGARDQHLLVLALLSETDPLFQARLSRRAALSEAERPSADHLPVTAEGVPLAAAAKALGDVRPNLMPDAPLQRYCLIEASGANVAAMAGSYRLAQPVLAYLVGLAAPQLHLDGTLLADVVADGPLDEHLVDERLKHQLRRFVENGELQSMHKCTFMLRFEGADDAMMESLCAASFDSLGYTTARLDARDIRRSYDAANGRRAGLMKLLRVLCRDAVLCNQLLLLTHAQCLAESGGREPQAARDPQADLLDDVFGLLFETQRYVGVVNGPARALAQCAHRFVSHEVVPITLRVEAPDAHLRRSAWLKYAERVDLVLDEGLLERLVDGYRFTEERIAIILKEVVSHRWLVDSERDLSNRLVDACRAEAEASQLGIAQEIKRAHRLTDIVAPSDTIDQLNELLSHMKYRRQVVDEWGFAGKHAGSCNLSALFHGPSGTGKTMGAAVIANELQMSLYRVDLASVMSKYIGETEQHLSQLFEWAEGRNVVLFFDEAEALFGKRTETKDAHDRYANLQIGYLLQRIETHPGLVILATNLMPNIDKAFLRRFRFLIEFPFPSAEQREALWRQSFPGGVPLASDVDFELLAHRAALAGGSIHNVVLSAAFRAAAEGTPVQMHHVVRSLEREYEKIGKLFSPGDFSF
ncbi:ATP-binding protein [Trinickia caryophylli]|nr:ATP-binding protein [Trinickia caryophylli]TRX20180.1 ATP-binding protein [Trinickia caryophylli]